MHHIPGTYILLYTVANIVYRSLQRHLDDRSTHEYITANCTLCRAVCYVAFIFFLLLTVNSLQCRTIHLSLLQV